MVPSPQWQPVGRNVRRLLFHVKDGRVKRKQAPISSKPHELVVRSLSPVTEKTPFGASPKNLPLKSYQAGRHTFCQWYAELRVLKILTSRGWNLPLIFAERRMRAMFIAQQAPRNQL